MKKVDRLELIEACREYLGKKISIVQKSMKGLKEDLENESKSSAGDKYETGREMINIEWNKLSVQLNEYDRLSQILKRIEDHKPANKAVLGSIVITNKANYFLSIPAGEILVNGQKFYAVGMLAPISQKLLGKECGEKLQMNGNELEILQII